MIRSRTPEPPYCWQNKDALRKLREHLDGDSLLPYALAVYFAMTENASDKGCESFTTLQSHIATLAGGISTRTIRRVIPILRGIGLLAYETPKLKGPITFTLLSVVPVSLNDRTASPNDGTISPNVRTTKNSGFQSANRRTMKEQKKNNEESAFAPVFESEDFRTAWNDFIIHRKQKGSPLKAKSYELLSQKLRTMGEPVAVAALRASIENGWTGVFPPERDQHEKPKYDPIGKPLNEAARRIVAAKAGRSPL